MNYPGYQLSFNTLGIANSFIRLQQTVLSYPAGQRFISICTNTINNKRLLASCCKRV